MQFFTRRFISAFPQITRTDVFVNVLRDAAGSNGIKSYIKAKMHSMQWYWWLIIRAFSRGMLLKAVPGFSEWTFLTQAKAAYCAFSEAISKY